MEIGRTCRPMVHYLFLPILGKYVCWAIGRCGLKEIGVPYEKHVYGCPKRLNTTMMLSLNLDKLTCG